MRQSAFESRITKHASGCWHWTGRISRTGYGDAWKLMPDGKKPPYPAHRLAYERAHGVDLPRRGEPGHRQVDHTCHNRSKSCPGGRSCLHRRCVNPTHLVLATAKENSEASSNTPAHRNRRKTHCSRGHAFTPDNTYIQVRKNGTTVSRSCKRCQIDNRTRNRRAARARS